MTADEQNVITEKLYTAFKNVPGIDRNFLEKCVQSLVDLNDSEVEAKIKYFMNFL